MKAARQSMIALLLVALMGVLQGPACAHPLLSTPTHIPVRKGASCLVVQSDTMVRKLEWSKAKHFLDRALVRGCGIVFRHYYKSIAQGAGKERRDCAVVPFKSVDWSLVLHSIVLLGFAPFTTLFCCDFTRVTATLLECVPFGCFSTLPVGSLLRPCGH